MIAPTNMKIKGEVLVGVAFWNIKQMDIPGVQSHSEVHPQNMVPSGKHTKKRLKMVI